MSVAKNHLGVPPATAMSLALTFTAYQPMRSVAKVIGSVLAVMCYRRKNVSGILAKPWTDQ